MESRESKIKGRNKGKREEEIWRLKSEIEQRRIRNWDIEKKKVRLREEIDGMRGMTSE